MSESQKRDAAVQRRTELAIGMAETEMDEQRATANAMMAEGRIVLRVCMRSLAQGVFDKRLSGSREGDGGREEEEEENDG